MNRKIKVSRRSCARDCVFKAVYAKLIASASLVENIQTNLKNTQAHNPDEVYAKALIENISQNENDINSVIEPALDKRSSSTTTHVEMAILVVAVAELLYHHDVPHKVVINEAIELSKKYGTDDGYRFINGVLDNIEKGLHGNEDKV